MLALYSVVGLALGALSAFYIFAAVFNGVSESLLALYAIPIVICSALVGKFIESWKNVILSFFVPYLFLFALFIMGAIEKGGWHMVLPIIAIISAVIWLPAFFISKLNKS